TSDRPYRRAMTEEAALAIIRERRGTMYDPRVVDTFERAYRDIEVGEADTPEHREVLRRITSSRSGGPEPTAAPVPAAAPNAPPPPAAAGPIPASNHVLAFVSLSRIASGEGSVADVLALSSNLIGDIMPEATGAWYLPDAGRTDLAVQDPFGPAAQVLRGMSVSVGQRLTGWVAASRQSIVNSDAALDLESVAE